MQHSARPHIHSSFISSLAPYKKEIAGYLQLLSRLGKVELTQNAIWQAWLDYAEQANLHALAHSEFARALFVCQSAIVSFPWVYFAVRPAKGQWTFFRIHGESIHAAVISTAEFLALIEQSHAGIRREHVLELNIDAFGDGMRKLGDENYIGRGIASQNKRLFNQAFHETGSGARHLLRFLRAAEIADLHTLLNDKLDSIFALKQALSNACDLLEGIAPTTPWGEIEYAMQSLGFASGWGSQAAQVHTRLSEMLQLCETPESGLLYRILSGIPCVRHIVIVAVHGYLGQDANVGLPDTLGQLTYALNLARALEKAGDKTCVERGLPATTQVIVLTRQMPNEQSLCEQQRIEKIAGAQHARVLRIPIRDAEQQVVAHWLPYAALWPYLENFAVAAEQELLAELGRAPDLVLGVCADGNLVAYLLSRRFQCSHIHIAHPFDQSGFAGSPLKIPQTDTTLHQRNALIADLVSLNCADMVVAHRLRDIAGDDRRPGYIEHFQTFTIPGFLRVIKGVDIFDERMHVLQPGIDHQTFFSYADHRRRSTAHIKQIRNLLSGAENHFCAGELKNPDRPILLAVSQTMPGKNLVGWVASYLHNANLLAQTNLVILTGPELAPELKSQAQRDIEAKLKELVQLHPAREHIRWIDRWFGKELIGEWMRYAADTKGALVQPAFDATMGFTVLEAMACGLPVFASQYGGPADVIEHGHSGFIIDPERGAESAEMMAEFFARCHHEPNIWRTISSHALACMRDRYQWDTYAERLLGAVRVNAFWRDARLLARDDMQQIFQFVYALQFGPRCH